MLRRWALAMLFVAAGCSRETSILLVVHGDLVTGSDLDGIGVALYDRGAQLSSASYSLAAEDDLPQRYTINLPEGSGAVLELSVTATHEGRSVLAATRTVSFVPGQRVEVQLCLWRQCLDSDDPGCLEGRCEPPPALGDGDADADGDADGGSLWDADVVLDIGFEVSRPAVVAGQGRSCAVDEAGSVRCWGHNHVGQLGYGHTQNIGDDELAGSAGDVDVGGPVLQLSAGAHHLCALLEDGSVRCWGQGWNGRLGYGNSEWIGDDETPASAGDVPLGEPAVQIAAAAAHSCALLEGGRVRCWGNGSNGALGYGNTESIGDDETPASAGDVDVGGRVVQIAARGEFTCALLEGGTVRCWGEGEFGQLGHGGTENIGDDETPASQGDVDVGGQVGEISLGWRHVCVVLLNGAVRCWGHGHRGRLGLGSTGTIGDDELPSTAGNVPVGGPVNHIACGAGHTCALLVGGGVRCWGDGEFGQLGYGATEHIGDEAGETPAIMGDVDIGAAVLQLAPAGWHTCALLATGAIRCWGQGTLGQLGQGNTESIGDDEYPVAGGDVPIW